jgi:hypothetical protein
MEQARIMHYLMQSLENPWSIPPPLDRSLITLQTKVW